MLEIIEANPGIPLAALRAQLELGWGTTYHHLAKLERAGLVRALGVGRRRVVVSSSCDISDAEMRARGLLHGPTARRVAELVAGRPRTRILDISAALGESDRVIYYHVGQLLKAGLLTSGSQTRHFDLRPTPLLERLLGGSQ